MSSPVMAEVKEPTTAPSHDLPALIARTESKSITDEKHSVDVEVDEVVTDGLEYKDEALKLVGMQRTQEFSEEYYRKLRRKLVCSDIFINPCIRP